MGRWGQSFGPHSILRSERWERTKRAGRRWNSQGENRESRDKAHGVIQVRGEEHQKQIKMAGELFQSSSCMAVGYQGGQTSKMQLGWATGGFRTHCCEQRDRLSGVKIGEVLQSLKTTCWSCLGFPKTPSPDLALVLWNRGLSQCL